jgi:protocatechuate 3,4-dioxygenase beta subunit
MTSTTTSPQVEIVVVAANQESTLEPSLRRLHAHLLATHPDHFPGAWRVTIADHASTDGTAAVADRLAGELIGISTVRIPHRLDRKALRSTWKTSDASVAAFVTLTPTIDLPTTLSPLVRHTAPSSVPVVSGLTRRGALIAAGGVGLAALLAACGSSGSSDSAATSGAGSTGGNAATTGGSTETSAASGAATTAAAAVALAPEMTEGPYYLDLDLVRNDITEDREGVPLALNLVVIDVNSGAPLEGAAVDVWHCDAEGLYSGFVDASASANSGASDLSDSGTFLRGTQVTDASGAATFATIYPGWYQGRTVHIHIKVRANGGDIHTGQLFFDDAFTDEVYATAEPYASRNGNRLLNTDDNIFQSGGDLSTLVVTETAEGYTSSLTMGVSA